MKYVSGKVVLITGGAGGIGLAMVKELLNNGAKGIAILDVSEEAGDKAINEISASFGDNKVIFIKTDITIKEQLKEAFEITVKTYNQLDIVINNAGIVDEMDWEKTIAINLVAVIAGTYLAMHEYLPKFKSGEEGVIVNTSSLAGLYPLKVAPIYTSTKHGVVGLGRSLGRQKLYKKYKVRVLTICPTFVKTTIFAKATSYMNNFSTESLPDSAMLSPECVAEALIEVIQNGKNGSLWVLETDEPTYEIKIPYPKKMKVMKT